MNTVIIKAHNEKSNLKQLIFSTSEKVTIISILKMALAHSKQNGRVWKIEMLKSHTIHLLIGHSQTKLSATDLTNPTKVQIYWQNQEKLRSERH